MSDDGRKQQVKLKELGHIAEKLGCTLPQLAVGKSWEGGCSQATAVPLCPSISSSSAHQQLPSYNYEQNRQTMTVC